MQTKKKMKKVIWRQGEVKEKKKDKITSWLHLE
jgi:hypothetical protein